MLLETLEEHGLAVGAGETGTGGGRLLLRRAPVAHQWLDITHRGSEELRILFGNPLHATSDFILLSILTRPPRAVVLNAPP